MKEVDSHTKRAARWAALFTFFSIVACIGWLFGYNTATAPKVAEKSVAVLIPHGTSVAGIGHILAKAGLIYDDIRFPLNAKLTGYSRKFRVGEFRIATGQNPLSVMRQLAEAAPELHPVTIPEGLRADEIARIYAEGKWCDYDEFLKLVRDPAFIKSLGIGPESSLEGYLFPDTYYLTPLANDAASIIRMMVHRFTKVWTDLEKNAEKKIGRHDAVILASMVEKETAGPRERPLVAAVFYNRLRLGMRLQSDPTVTYGQKESGAGIDKEDLHRDTPYNTYMIPALPIGPICNPGKSSLEAVLHPAHENYLYFVSKSDGTHQFSKTLEEHNKAVQTYRRNKNGKEQRK